jgi:hypothetical protein
VLAGNALGGKVTGEIRRGAAKRKKSAISKGRQPHPDDEALLAGQALGGEVAGQRLKAAAKRKRFAISKGRQPHPDDEALLAGQALGGKANKDDKLWMKHCERLKAYQLENGPGSFPPSSYPKDKQLGYWVEEQRRQKRQNKLDAVRVKLLNDIGFVWNLRDMRWMVVQFRRLQAYQLENGPGSFPPRSYPQDKQLATWVDKQRQGKRNNKVDPDRVKRLDDIGFVWVPRGS